jgi:hypothetical protein
MPRHEPQYDEVARILDDQDETDTPTQTNS